MNLMKLDEIMFVEHERIFKMVARTVADFRGDPDPFPETWPLRQEDINRGQEYLRSTNGR